MTPKGVSILSNPHPCEQVVYQYTDDTLVAEAVALYSSAGLKDGEASTPSPSRCCPRLWWMGCPTKICSKPFWDR